MKNNITPHAGSAKPALRLSNGLNTPINIINILLILIIIFLCAQRVGNAADMAARLKDDTANSGFSVINASGTTTARFRGDGMVGIGTTTPQARFAIVGTSTAPSLEVINSAGTVTFFIDDNGQVGIGTTTPMADSYLDVYGTTTTYDLRVWGNAAINGTVTAASFIGDGSGLTNISASSSSVNSATIVDNSITTIDIQDNTITGSDLATNLSLSTTGTMSVASGNFVVDSAGAMTAASITSTGTVTISGKNLITYSGNTTNTFIGVGAGSANTTGNNNSAYGYQALFYNTTSSNNTANGYQALYSNTSGAENTANGYQALHNNTTGAENTANGMYSLHYNTTGNNNTALGRSAGYSTLGSNNVFLGYQAGYSETGTNTLYIGNSSSNTLIYGNFGSTTVGIGTTTPSTALVVIGTITATQGFVGNGSGLTGISASPGADSVNSSSIVDGSISGSDLASTLSMATKSLDIGSITVNAGNFRVDSTGSMTASTITSTGSVTASSITATGTLTASGNLNIDAGTLFVDAVNNRVGISTTTPSTALHVIGTVTVSGGYYGYNGIVLDSEGSSSPSKGIRLTNGTNNSYVNTNAQGTLEYNSEVDHVFYTGSVTERLRITSTLGNVGIGTNTPQTKLVVVGTVTATAYAGGGAYTHYMGELYGGGVVFYVYKTAGVEHGLICAVEDQGTSTVWSDYDTTLIGTSAQSNWDGLSNSNAIANYGTSTVSAAKLCLDYTNTDTGTGVYSDWYLPSKRELSLMYSQAFIIEKVLSPSGVFGSYYWSSTESDYFDAFAWIQNFGGGSQSYNGKTDTYYVRAVRAF